MRVTLVNKENLYLSALVISVIYLIMTFMMSADSLILPEVSSQQIIGLLVLHCTGLWYATKEQVTICSYVVVIAICVYDFLTSFMLLSRMLDQSSYICGASLISIFLLIFTYKPISMLYMFASDPQLFSSIGKFNVERKELSILKVDPSGPGIKDKKIDRQSSLGVMLVMFFVYVAFPFFESIMLNVDFILTLILQAIFFSIFFTLLLSVVLDSYYYLKLTKAYGG